MEHLKIVQHVISTDDAPQTRPVTMPQQIERVAELAATIWTEFYTPIIGTDQVAYMLKHFQSPEAITKQIEEQHYHYYLFGDIGYFATIPLGNVLFLSKIYLLHNERGKGYGTRMMEAVKEAAAENGYRSIELTVNKNNPSLNIYEALGFVNLGSTVQDIGGGFVMDDYLMCLTLPDV